MGRRHWVGATPRPGAVRREALDCQGRTRQHLAHSTDRMVGPGRGAPILPRLALPDRAVLRAVRRDGAACIARVPGRRHEPPGALDRSLRARVFIRRHLARPRLHGGRRVSPVSRHDRGRRSGSQRSGVGQGLPAAGLAPGQLRPADACQQGVQGPPGQHHDARRCTRRGCARSPASTTASRGSFHSAGPTASCAPTSCSNAARWSRRWRIVSTARAPAWTRSFLGRPASFPLGPHILAARAGVPVILCFGLYEGGADYRIEFVDFGPAAPVDCRGAMLQPTVDRYALLARAGSARTPEELVQLLPLLDAMKRRVVRGLRCDAACCWA